MTLPVNTILRGDALPILRGLPDACADAVITDPPYSSGGMFRGDRMLPAREKYQDSGTAKTYEDFPGDNRDQRSFLAWASLWLAECYRLAKPGAVCAIFTDWRQLPTVTDAIQAGGFVWRGIGAWDKTEAARPQKGRFRQQCEFLVWGTKGPAPIEGECLPGVWRLPVVSTRKQHITGKPVDLMLEILRITPPHALILDPFAGSGSTAVAALKSGRRFLGIEMQPEIAAVAESRLQGEAGLLRLGAVNF